MKQVLSLPLIFLSFFGAAGTLQAETSSLGSDSPVNISHEMDMALRANTLDSSIVGETIWTDAASKKAGEIKPAKLKSPTKAFVIALVPGSVVHGAGYFYAGKTKTALGVFGAEILGAGMAYVGALGMSLTSDTGGKTTGAGGVLFIFGLGLFTGSWIYDVIGSPFAVKNENDKILGKKPFPYDLNMKFDEKQQQIKCLVVKRF